MAAADLATLDDVKTFLNKPAPLDDQKLTTLITQASLWLESSALAGRPLAERTFTAIRVMGPRSTKLYPPASPINIVSPITVKVDEIVQTVWKQESDGDVGTFDVIVDSDNPWDSRLGLRNHFARPLGWASALGGAWGTSEDSRPVLRRVLLTYTGGYKLTPVAADGSSAVPEDLKLACLYLVQKLWRDLDKQQTGLTVITLPTGGSIAVAEPAMPKEVLQLIAPYRRFVLAGV